MPGVRARLKKKYQLKVVHSLKIKIKKLGDIESLPSVT
jgi:hypothetical protein